MRTESTPLVYSLPLPMREGLEAYPARVLAAPPDAGRVGPEI